MQAGIQTHDGPSIGKGTHSWRSLRPMTVQQTNRCLRDHGETVLGPGISPWPCAPGRRIPAGRLDAWRSIMKKRDIRKPTCPRTRASSSGRRPGSSPRTSGRSGSGCRSTARPGTWRCSTRTSTACAGAAISSGRIRTQRSLDGPTSLDPLARKGSSGACPHRWSGQLHHHIP